MSQNDSKDLHTDYTDIELEVTLKTGISYKGLKCSLLRTYSEKYYACDADALITLYEINGIRVNGNIIEPKEYSKFRDENGREWQIASYKQKEPPEAPAIIFRLLKS